MDPILMAALMGGSAIGNGLSAYGARQGQRAYGKAVQPYIDQYQAEGQGLYDFTAGQYGDQNEYGDQALKDMWAGIQSLSLIHI